MAAPGRNVLVLAHEQLRRGRQIAGETPEQIEEFDRVFEDFVTRVVEGAPIDTNFLDVLVEWIDTRLLTDR
jgi:hypothetical protein